MSKVGSRLSAGQFNNKILNKKKMNSLSKTVRLKKLKTLLSLNDEKILEIKGLKKRSNFHLIGENEQYKVIEKKIQNKIINISMSIIDNYKVDVDIEGTNVPRKNRSKSISNIQSKFHSKIKSPKFTGIRRSHIHNFPNTKIYKQILYEKNRRIKRIHKVHDSFGEDESDKDMEQTDYGLNPRSIFIDIYDMLFLISVEFCLFYIPYRLAKTKMVIYNDEYSVLFMIYFSEIIYIIDLIFGFFRWYYNIEFTLISNRNMIISNYIYGNFFSDLIMAIPFYSILKFKALEIEKNDIYNENNIFLKILICIKSFKIIKVNNAKNNRIIYFLYQQFSKFYYLEKIYQIFHFIIIVSSVFNIFICFHIYIAKLSYPNWIVSSNLQDKPFVDIYQTSLYFIITTLTSVGYGDIVCKSKEETCFQIVLLSIGLVVYSFIISTVGDYVQNKSKAAINYDKNMAKLEEIRIQYPNIPYKLYNKIKLHIERMLSQSKKIEYNILINSLPYYLQNSVLFQIHKTEINKFSFFKHCDNSDFILKVLTHFIPIFSKKNNILVGEGEYLENIFFIKEGRLSLEAIIDLEKIEMSIEKYLKYRFEEIEQIEDYTDKNDPFQKKSYMKKVSGNEMKSKIFFEIINKQFENIEDNPKVEESNLEQEIGKCGFHEENQDLCQGDIKYINILDLLKNEYYGEILMFLNIPNPLSLKVKSKKVELYILRKKDAFNIKRDYQNIWQRISKKSIHNLKSLKSVTLDIINRYCKMNGILIKGTKIINANVRPRVISSNYKTSNLNYRSQNLSQKKIGCKLPSKEYRFSLLKNKNIIIGKKSEKLVNKMKFKQNLDIIGKRERYKSVDSNMKSISLNNTPTHKNSSSSLNFSNNNYFVQDKNLKKLNNNDINNTNNLNMDKGIFTINESEYSKSNNFNKVTKETSITFQISSSYKNINEMSKGHYIKDNKFQDLIQNIIKSYINNEQNDYLKDFSDLNRKGEYIQFSNKNNINIQTEDIKNNFTFNSLKNLNIAIYKEISESEPGDSKSINSINHLNPINNNLNKNQEIFSESINDNLIKKELNNNILNNKLSYTLNKLNYKEGNNPRTNKKIKKKNSPFNIYNNNGNIIKNNNQNNIQEVKVNYVNNFCIIA